MSDHEDLQNNSMFGVPPAAQGGSPHLSWGHTDPGKASDEFYEAFDRALVVLLDYLHKCPMQGLREFCSTEGGQRAPGLAMLAQSEISKRARHGEF